MIKTIIFIAGFILTYLGVEVFRRIALKKELYDVPNERSSHRSPVPRGGGIVIILINLCFLYLYRTADGETSLWSYFCAASLIAAISFYDDLKRISILWRILIHGIAAALLIFQFGYWEQIYIPFLGIVNFGDAGIALTFLWIVWLINAYNFMDGIDGLAAVQAVLGGFGWLAAGVLLHSETAIFLGGMIACSSFGFFLHNRSPAKIFMGDVGSTFLGLTFAALPLLVKSEIPPRQEILPFAGLMIVWLFIFDTLLTFLRRLLNGKKVWQAHREHLYQRIADSKSSHNSVTAIYAFSTLSVISALLAFLFFGNEMSEISLIVGTAVSLFPFIFQLSSQKKEREKL